uniref:Uncharacterized protein n=1 Tax=Anopheles darlingi TaxID=43151 RepID=A0A2M4D5U1_ANODA
MFFFLFFIYSLLQSRMRVSIFLLSCLSDLPVRAQSPPAAPSFWISLFHLCFFFPEIFPSILAIFLKFQFLYLSFELFTILPNLVHRFLILQTFFCQ